MWIVKLTKTPIINDFRSGYFPRRFAYKRDAIELAKEVRSKGGDVVIHKADSTASDEGQPTCPNCDKLVVRLITDMDDNIKKCFDCCSRPCE